MFCFIYGKTSTPQLGHKSFKYHILSYEQALSIQHRIVPGIHGRFKLFMLAPYYYYLVNVDISPVIMPRTHGATGNLFCLLTETMMAT